MSATLPSRRVVGGASGADIISRDVWERRKTKDIFEDWI